MKGKATKGFAWMDLDAVTPWAGNPRDNDHAAELLVAAIRRFGFVAPIVIWEGRNEIVAGHTRLKAMQAILAETPDFIPRGAPGPRQIPVRVMPFEDEQEAKAYALADNKLGELADWDNTVLTQHLVDLAKNEIDPTILGWSESDLFELAVKFAPDEQNLIMLWSGNADGDDDGDDDFPEYGDDIETDHTCPKCGYEWSGGGS